MAMSKKDYQLIAEMVSVTRKNTTATHDALDELVENLGFAMLLDNPRFDRDRFREACE
jgi:hypothetical protein